MNLGRVAQGGRNFEGFGADPFLSGEAAYETILGMQQAGVQACAKHYINNEQEHKRTTSSSEVDDRTQACLTIGGPQWSLTRQFSARNISSAVFEEHSSWRH